MKLISNFKDYYDFLQGKYGIDPLITYERICLTCNFEKGKAVWAKAGMYKPQHLQGEDYSFQFLAVCGVIYCVYFYKGHFYFGDECEALPKTYRKKYDFANSFGLYKDKAAAKYHGTKTDINDRENCPVMIVDLRERWVNDKVGYQEYFDAAIKNPRLSDFGFGKCLSAEKCYLAITNFLSREKPVVDNRTDIQKVVGKGFDKKYSFRKRPVEV